MQLTHPSALLWLLLALPLIALYLLKVRRRRVPVSTILFWDQVFGDRRPRALWQRLRHPLSLLLQLLLLLLLTLALADPRFTWQSLQGRQLVLVLDNSASMQATDVAPNRWSWAVHQARQLIRGLGPQDQVAIVSAGNVPRVEVGLTDHPRTLLQSLDRISLTDGPTRVTEAVQLAQRLLHGKPVAADPAHRGSSVWRFCRGGRHSAGVAHVWHGGRQRGHHAVAGSSQLDRSAGTARLDRSRQFLRPAGILPPECRVG